LIDRLHLTDIINNTIIIVSASSDDYYSRPMIITFSSTG